MTGAILMDETTTLSAETDDEAGEQRTGTDPDPLDFGAAQQALNDATKRVNAVWISFVLLCVYIFIATYTVTPAALFRDAPVKLPIFNADLPLKVYFLLAPFLILCLHAYLIVLAKDLAEKVNTYEDVLSQSANMSATIAAGRNVLHTRLENSIIIRAMSARTISPPYTRRSEPLNLSYARLATSDKQGPARAPIRRRELPSLSWRQPWLLSWRPRARPWRRASPSFRRYAPTCRAGRANNRALHAGPCRAAPP
jgi:hypothetical protein